MVAAKPLSARKLDLAYAVFFIIHILVIFLIDIVPFYPESWVPSISVSIRNFYITTYRDRFFISPTPWFKAYLVLEVVYHLPVSLWIIGALAKGSSSPV